MSLNDEEEYEHLIFHELIRKRKEPKAKLERFICNLEKQLKEMNAKLFYNVRPGDPKFFFFSSGKKDILSSVNYYQLNLSNKLNEEEITKRMSQMKKVGRAVLRDQILRLIREMEELGIMPEIISQLEQLKKYNSIIVLLFDPRTSRKDCSSCIHEFLHIRDLNLFEKTHELLTDIRTFFLYPEGGFLDLSNRTIGNSSLELSRKLYEISSELKINPNENMASVLKILRKKFSANKDLADLLIEHNEIFQYGRIEISQKEINETLKLPASGYMRFLNDIKEFIDLETKSPKPILKILPKNFYKAKNV